MKKRILWKQLPYVFLSGSPSYLFIYCCQNCIILCASPPQRHTKKVQLFLSLWRTVLHIFLRDMVTVSQHVEELSVEQIKFVN